MPVRKAPAPLLRNDADPSAGTAGCSACSTGAWTTAPSGPGLSVPSGHTPEFVVPMRDAPAPLAPRPFLLLLRRLFRRVELVLLAREEPETLPGPLNTSPSGLLAPNLGDCGAEGGPDRGVRGPTAGAAAGPVSGEDSTLAAALGDGGGSPEPRPCRTAPGSSTNSLSSPLSAPPPEDAPCTPDGPDAAASTGVACPDRGGNLALVVLPSLPLAAVVAVPPPLLPPLPPPPPPSSRPRPTPPLTPWGRAGAGSIMPGRPGLACVAVALPPALPRGGDGEGVACDPRPGTAGGPPVPPFSAACRCTMIMGVMGGEGGGMGMADVACTPRCRCSSIDVARVSPSTSPSPLAPVPPPAPRLPALPPLLRAPV